jgi:hypothetical protein
VQRGPAAGAGQSIRPNWSTLGIFEYFNDTDAVIFSSAAGRTGGAVIVSNMLTSSPQIDFVLRGIGWAIFT